jgi:nucleotide-binding universal stress UspA family protein
MAEDFKKILVGVDDSPDAISAFQYAIHRAKADGSELIIVSVLESDEMNVYQALTKDYVHGEREELEEHLNKYVDLAQKAGIAQVRGVIAEGDPGEEIVKTVIPKYQPDLLIIGAKADKGIAKLMGSQATYMVKHARISVMVIRD